MSNPFKAIMDIRKGERLFSFLMAGYFFLIITTFWILKPLKKAAFLTFYKDSSLNLFGSTFSSADAELWAKVANMFVAIAAVTIFTLLSKRYVRQQLSLIFSGFFILCFFGLSLTTSSSSATVVWNFYLLGDLYSTLMVATFFIFLNDSVRSESAKRLYGLVGLGGVLGGAFGSITVRTLIKSGAVLTSDWLLICISITVLIAIIAVLAAKYAPVKHGYEIDDFEIDGYEIDGYEIDNQALQTDSQQQSKTVKTGSENPVLEGARLVFNSKYLFSIVLIIGLYEMSSTLIDYQFTRTLLHFVAPENLSAAFGTAYVFINITAVIVQVFFTGIVMNKFGIKSALLILPIAILLVSTGFLLTPILAVAMVMPSADGGLNYSINQSAREVLYVPLDKDQKYKAKAFIDMFVQRFAKVIAIGVTLVITSFFEDFSTVRWLSIGTLIIIVLWIAAVRYAGREFEKITASEKS